MKNSVSEHNREGPTEFYLKAKNLDGDKIISENHAVVTPTTTVMIPNNEIITEKRKSRQEISAKDLLMKQDSVVSEEK